MNADASHFEACLYVYTEAAEIRNEGRPPFWPPPARRPNAEAQCRRLAHDPARCRQYRLARPGRPESTPPTAQANIRPYLGPALIYHNRRDTTTTRESRLQLARSAPHLTQIKSLQSNRPYDFPLEGHLRGKPVPRIKVKPIMKKPTITSKRQESACEEQIDMNLIKQVIKLAAPHEPDECHRVEIAFDKWCRHDAAEVLHADRIRRHTLIDDNPTSG